MAAITALIAVTAGGCSTSSLNDRSTAGSALGPFPFAAPETGWNCPGGVCEWDADEPVDKTPAGGLGAEAGLPRGALVVAGVANDLVAAAVHDDRDRPDGFLRLRTEALAADPTASTGVDLERRVDVRVVDSRGVAVLGARVVLFDGADQPVTSGRTHADGWVTFFPTASEVVRAEVAFGFVATAAPLSGASTVIRLDAPIEPTASPNVDVMFVLDATRSMADEFDRLRRAIRDVVDQAGQLPARPALRWGLTVYRDQDELFLTRTFDLSSQSDRFAAALEEVRAGGGGDTPDALAAGLSDALSTPSWRDDAIKLVVLITDAPAHPGSGPVLASARERATDIGATVVAVGASGIDVTGEYLLRELALATRGRFVAVAYGGSSDTSQSSSGASQSVERSRSAQLDPSDLPTRPLAAVLIEALDDELGALGRA